MFGRGKGEGVITVDDFMYFRRDGKLYRQLSFWENGTRYSTLIDTNVYIPPKGTVVSRSILNSWKAGAFA